MPLMIDYNNISILHRYLFSMRYQDDWPHNTERAFFIHSSVLPNVRNLIPKFFGLNSFTHIWPYQLAIGEQSLDTNLVIIKNQPLLHMTDSLINFSDVSELMNWLISVSQYLFIFVDAAFRLFFAYYTTVEEFSKLQEFIETENLQDYIVKITMYKGVNLNTHNEPIKIVTFKNESIVYYKFKSYEKSLTKKSTNYSNRDIFHYHITYAFPWLQPSEMHPLPELDGHNKICHGLLIFLQWLRENSYTTATLFNIMELCTMHYTFCNVHANQSDACLDLSIDIQQLVNKSYQKLKDQNLYIQDDQFDIYDYAVDRKCDKLLPKICDYIIYNFQYLFNSLKMPKYEKYGEVMQNGEHELCIDLIKKNKPKKTIKLVDEDDVVNKIRNEFSYNYTIDGIHFSGMNLQLIAELFQFHNVHKIILDTSYKWVSSQLTKLNAYNSNAVITLKGNNKYNFTENFITDLKTMVNIKNLLLLIEDGKSNPKNYLIFDDLNIRRIMFCNIKIELSMLQNLLLSSPNKEWICFDNCKIENNIRVWIFLNSLNTKIQSVSLIEEEQTWQCMYDYIIQRITTDKISKFKFDFDLNITSKDCYTKVRVNFLTFTINECKSKLLLWNTGNIVVDLFDLKNPEKALGDDDDDDDDDDADDDNDNDDFEYDYDYFKTKQVMRKLLIK